MIKGDEIRRLSKAAPFEPFEIRMSDGRAYVVEHPEFMMMSRDLSLVFLALDPDENNDFQTRVTLAVDHVTGLEENAPRRPSRRRKKSA